MNMGKWIHDILVIISMTLLLGLQFWASGLSDSITTGYRVIQWSSTEGIVISSISQSCGYSTTGRRGGEVRHHGSNPKISYSYSVNNVTYMADRVEFVPPLSRFSSCIIPSQGVEAMVGRHPVNTSVLVHFNREQPNDAFIVDVGIVDYMHSFWQIGMGIVVIFLFWHSILRIYK
jgi:hypothetical protein